MSAAGLRKLLIRQRFSTPEFMKVMGLGEPAATDALIELEAAGWIAWAHQHDAIDWWEPTDQGHRLTATRLIKRFPIAIGLKIVDQVVEQAARINRDPSHSMRITELYLFGSVLKGSPDGTAGDVDIVCVAADRKLEKLALENLKDRELALFPNAGFFERMGIPERIIKRKLRSISTKIALHQSSDLDLRGLEYRQIYAFDVVREQEVPFDAAIQIGRGKHADPVAPSTKSVQRYPKRQFRPWPSYPPSSVRISIEGDTGREAQHMWQNGASAADIARRTHRAEADLLGFLASRSDSV